MALLLSNFFVALERYAILISTPFNYSSKIATVTGLSIDFFFRPAPEVDISFYRKKDSLKVKKQEKIRAQVAEWLERYLEVEELFPDRKIIYSPPKCKRLINNLEDIERLVIELRSEWKSLTTGIAGGLSSPIRALLQACL